MSKLILNQLIRENNLTIFVTLLNSYVQTIIANCKVNQ